MLPEIGKAVDDMGWGLPTDIQSEAIPLILGGGDVLLAAETGSGKTGAFCLPVLQITWESLKVCTLHSCPKYVFILGLYLACNACNSDSISTIKRLFKKGRAPLVATLARPEAAVGSG